MTGWNIEKTAQEAPGGGGIDAAAKGVSWAGGKFADMVAWALKNGLYAAAAAPVVAGVGIGAAASGITSPGEEDMEQLEKRLILSEQERLAARLRRSLELSAKKRQAVGMEAPGEGSGRDILR